MHLYPLCRISTSIFYKLVIFKANEVRVNVWYFKNAIEALELSPLLMILYHCCNSNNTFSGVMIPRKEPGILGNKPDYLGVCDGGSACSGTGRMSAAQLRTRTQTRSSGGGPSRGPGLGEQAERVSGETEGGLRDGLANLSLASPGEREKGSKLDLYLGF